MDIHQFLELFVGRWRSQRSNHQFGQGNDSDIRSVIEIASLSLDDPNLITICQQHGVDPQTAMHPMQMSWEEESLSSNKPKGSAVIVAIPNDLAAPQKGEFLTGQSKGSYEFGIDESLTIQTTVNQGAIVERIWYGNPNLRFRVATWLQGEQTSDRRVQSSKFYSEIRSVTTKT